MVTINREGGKALPDEEKGGNKLMLTLRTASEQRHFVGPLLYIFVHKKYLMLLCRM